MRIYRFEGKLYRWIFPDIVSPPDLLEGDVVIFFKDLEEKETMYGDIRICLAYHLRSEILGRMFFPVEEMVEIG